ncbi:MAG: thiamine-phosphate kinase [Defluviicoccus sp.]|nr:thiamine-phosphate kinase [Defluviicoccus sp.]
MPGRPRPGEFELIRELFAPLAADEPGALGLLDDAALIAPRAGFELVTAIDTIVEGVHFLPADPPFDIARKLLRVNLSDLAAMGARPRAYLLGIAMPDAVDLDWLREFANGLASDQAGFGISLAGGDTTATHGPVCLSLTAIGEVAPGRALLRSNAAAGEHVYVSGTIGDAALGLRALLGEELGLSEEAREAVTARYRVPEPRLSLGMALPASAAVDVSDGLIADIGHICAASRLGARIEASRIPLSGPSRSALNRGAVGIVDLATGGDDYELAFTAPADRSDAIRAAAAKARVPVVRIGTMTEGSGVSVVDESGVPVRIDNAGYRHF